MKSVRRTVAGLWLAVAMQFVLTGVAAARTVDRTLDSASDTDAVSTSASVSASASAPLCEPSSSSHPDSAPAARWTDLLARLDAPSDADRRVALGELVAALKPASVPDLLEGCAHASPQARLAVHGALVEHGEFAAGLILALADPRISVRRSAVTLVERLSGFLQSRRGLDGLEGEAERRNPRVFPPGSSLVLEPRPRGPPSLLSVLLYLRRTGVLDRTIILDPRAARRVCEVRGILGDSIPEAPADFVLKGWLEDYGLVRLRFPSIHWLGLPVQAEPASTHGLADWMERHGVEWPEAGDGEDVPPARRLSLECLVLGWCADHLAAGFPEDQRALAVLSLASYGIPGLAASAGRLIEEMGGREATVAGEGPLSDTMPQRELISWVLAAAVACGDITRDPRRDARLIVPLLAASRSPTVRSIALAALVRLPLSASAAAVESFLGESPATGALDEAAVVALVGWLADSGVTDAGSPEMLEAIERAFPGSLSVAAQLLRLELAGVSTPRDLPDDLADRCLELAGLPGIAEALARVCRPGMGFSLGARLQSAGEPACRRIQAAAFAHDGDGDGALDDWKSWDLADGLRALAWAAPFLVVSGGEEAGLREGMLARARDPSVELTERIRCAAFWGRTRERHARGAAGPMPEGLTALFSRAAGRLEDPEALDLFFAGVASPEAGLALLDALQKAVEEQRGIEGLVSAVDRMGYLLARDAPGGFFRLRMRLQQLRRDLPEGSPLRETLSALDERLFAYSSSEDLGRRTIGLDQAGVVFP